MNRLKTVLANKQLRITLVVLIVGATLVLFANYLITHPDVITLLFSLHPAAIMLLALAYIGTILANAFVLSASLRMMGNKVGFLENASLTGYSSVVNFFGPLQSGPGFRAVYLKQRHGVSLKKFLHATIVFYGFFAMINGLVIAAAVIVRVNNSYAPPLIVGGLLVITFGALLVYRLVPAVRSTLRAVKLTDPYFWLIGIGALFLSICTTFAYFIELLYVDPTVNFIQSTVYAAAANLALFVSLTPGAIGFRESFLLLTQQLHQIPGNVVIAASIIDRAFYIVFLLGLFLFLLTIGARAKLRQSKTL